MRIWQGFDYTWAGVPHRVSGLATGLDGDERLAGIFPGVNGDTAMLRQHALRVTGTPPEIGRRLLTVDLQGTEDRTSERPHSARFEREVLEVLDVDPEHSAVAILQGIEWYPCGTPGHDAHNREGQFDGAVALWPTGLSVHVQACRRPGGWCVAASAAVSHADAPDPFKRVVSEPVHHHFRLHVTVLHGPRALMDAVGEHGVTPTPRAPHLRPLEPVRTPVDAALAPGRTWFPALTGLELGLSTQGRGKPGRYLRQVAAALVDHDLGGERRALTATVGWRGGGLPAPPRAWREGSVRTVLVGLPEGVAVEREQRVEDVLRFQLPGGSAGRRPRGPHVLIRGPDERVVQRLRWDWRQAG